MTLPLQIISPILLEEYKESFDKGLESYLQQTTEDTMGSQTISLFMAYAAMYSSRMSGSEDEQQAEDLLHAYFFIRDAELTAQSFVEAHAIFTKHLLPESQQGMFRTGERKYFNEISAKEYVAASPRAMTSEMMRFYVDLNELVNTQLNFEEIFYYSSMLHLVINRMQPFEDGNGRMGRLLEKWFLLIKLGPVAWTIPSEIYYADHSSMYEILSAKLGTNYGQLDYGEALFFLRMLPDAIRYNPG